MIDSIPPEFAFIAGLFFLAWWLVIEFRHAIPDPYPDELTGLDVLERTGVHPHG